MKSEQEKDKDEATEKPWMKLSDKYIKLVSKDEKCFYLNKQIACISKLIKRELKSKFMEGSTNTIHLSEIESIVLEKCIEYMHYKYI